MLRTTIHIGLLCLLVSYSLCYVFDVNYSHWYATNGTEYVSVLLQQKSNNFQMLAGAPKDDRLTVCNVNSCQNFAFSSKNSAGYEMFGASMSGGDKIGDPTYVCAPRYIATPQYRVNGRCFAVHQKFKSILSLDNVYQQVQLYNSTYEFYYAHGQAGFSVKHVEDDEFLLGAPGVLTWKGTIIKHTDLDTKDVLHPENKVERNSYLGYSIEYGLLSFGGRRRRCVIAGAPRGDNLLGQILKPQKSRKPLGDIDIGNEDSDDQTATTNKTCRRVSFASNNLVKPFVADPEKNTIWDLTYEEANEHSGSIQSEKSAQREIENDCNRLNVTLFPSTEACDEELDLTDPIVNNEIISNSSRNQNVEDNMEFTVPINLKWVAPINNYRRNDVIEGDMEFTVSISNQVIRNAAVESNLIDGEMEFTTPITTVYPSTNTSIEHSCDDTEKLLNYDLSGAKQSDFSKVIAGDIFPSFSNLPGMPLRGINSTSFVQDCLKEKKAESLIEPGDMEISFTNVDGVNPEIIVTSPTRTISSTDLMPNNSVNRSEVDMEISFGDYREVFVEETMPKELNSEVHKEIMQETVKSVGFNVATDGVFVSKEFNSEVREGNMQETVKSVGINVTTEGNEFTGDNSIIKFAKLSMEQTDFLYDTSAVSMDQSLSIVENLPCPASTNTIQMGIDFADVIPIDLEEAKITLKKMKETEALRNRYCNDMKIILNEANSYYKMQIEDYIKKKKLLDDFDNLRQKRSSPVSSPRKDVTKIDKIESEILTMKDKILRLYERYGEYWSIVSLDANPYKFKTLFGSIGLIVELNEENGQVSHIDLEDHISDKSQPIALYMHKIFMEKLKLDHIKAALGEKFEILSLLDYTRLTMEKVLEIDKDFSLMQCTYGVCMDPDFKITFALISVKCMFSWRFTIDARNHDGICADNVYIFDYTYIKDMVLKILKGDQISSYYGASLLVTNQYLLVGAPMYTTKSFEEGCVLVYLNTEDDLIFWQKLCGHHMGGRFGSAMTKIGVFEDSNGHVGVAISAPYADNGVGIVYVYIQTDNGFEEIQQISGRNVSTNTRGFGIGLSNAVDIDGNDYNDFAIASLSSDVLIILKSKKILSFSAELNPYVNKIGTNTKNISVAYCFTYTGRGSSMVGLDVTISLESDGRILVGNATRALGSKIGEKRCEDFVLTLKPQAFDSPSPLKIKVSNKLRECAECPVVYPKETAVSHQIPFVTGCKDENVCVPDLRLQADFVNVSELVIGSREAVSLTVLVSNLGETAFLCKMNMTITTEIRQFPPACSKTDNVLRCDISNRLLLNQKKQLEFQLDVKRLDPRLKEIKIDINVESAGFGSGSSATLTVALPVALQSSIALIGFSNPDFFENRESVNFTHEYVVFNNGPSPLLERLFQFKIPESIATSSGVIINAFGVSPLADECIPFDEPPLRKTRELTNLQQMLVAVPQATKYTISCKNNTLVKCRTYLCMIGEVNANSSLKFRFRIEVKTSLMFDALGDDQIEGKTLFLIESQATALHSNREEVSARTVLFKKPTEIINKWMWLVIAVIGSVVILSIIIGILYKLNFFARPMKERLMSEEAHKNERECMIVDDEAEDSSAVFNDIQF